MAAALQTRKLWKPIRNITETNKEANYDYPSDDSIQTEQTVKKR